MPPVAFNEIPSTLRVPGVFVEVNSSKAVRGVQLKPYKVLVIGQRLSTGTILQKVKKAVRSEEQARTYFGPRSMLHGMFKAIFQQRLRVDDIDCIALDDDGAGAAAAITCVVTASGSRNGTIHLYICGRYIPVPVLTGDLQNAIATNIRNAINAVDHLPVVASGSTNSVVITCVHKGLVGNELDVRLGYYSGEDVLPTGVLITNLPSTLTGGTVNPQIDASVQSAMGETQYDIVIFPYTDTNNQLAMDLEMGLRYGPMRSIQGQVFSAKRDTQVNLASYGNALNSHHVSTVGSDRCLEPPWEVAAAFGSRAAFELQQDPSRPLQTIEVDYLRAPAEDDRFTISERQLLYLDGITPMHVSPSGRACFDRWITMYQLSPGGAPDTAYLDGTTKTTLSQLRYDVKNRILNRFPRHKLAADGTRFGAGQPILTPAIVKGELIALFRDWEELGLVEDIEQFKRDLVVERNASDPNRLDIILPPNLVNGAMIFAEQLQFIL